MHPNDESHMTFYVGSDMLYRKVMLFKLVNIGVTYQRMINKLFKDMLGRNMEAYINDMHVKYIKGEKHTTDLREVLDCILQHNVLLNPSKFLFGG